MTDDPTANGAAETAKARRPRPAPPVIDLTADEVKAFCKDQIAHYKVPRHIQFVDEFPMTVTGKMQKFIMREKMAETLGVVAAVTA